MAGVPLPAVQSNRQEVLPAGLTQDKTSEAIAIRAPPTLMSAEPGKVREQVERTHLPQSALVPMNERPHPDGGWSRDARRRRSGTRP
jgi:hypothetical protein